jgi:hypothetical protein
MKLIVFIQISFLVVIKSIYIEKNNILASFSNEYFENNKNKPVFKQLEALIFKQSGMKKIKKTYNKLNFDSDVKKFRKSVDFMNDALPPNNKDNADYKIKDRKIKYFIKNNCNVIINENISYFASSTSIEHIILHNNAFSLVPINVTSDSIDINLFTFNKDLNMFYVFFSEKNFNSNTITIEYTYEAIGLIKSTNDKISNEFLWKFLNINTELPSKLEIEINIQTNDFGIEKVLSNLPFDIKKQNNSIRCEWKGRIDSQEILIYTMKFPLIFKNCEIIKVDYYMTFFGVLFLSFFIGMMYIILSSFLIKDF